MSPLQVASIESIATPLHIRRQVADMDHEWLDRLLANYRAERDYLHSQAGRFLTLALATLALIQFTVLDGGLYQEDPGRFLGFVAAGLSVAWLVVAPVPLLMASRANWTVGRWARVRAGWRDYTPLVLASYTLLFLAAVAAGGVDGGLAGAALGYLVLGGVVLDIAGFTAMQAWRPHRVYFALLFPRFMVAGALAAYGSGIAGESITNAERAMTVWPVIATSIAALWFVWSFNAWIKRRRSVAALSALLRDAIHGRATASEVERRYDDWLRTMADGNTPETAKQVDATDGSG